MCFSPVPEYRVRYTMSDSPTTLNQPAITVRCASTGCTSTRTER